MYAAVSCPSCPSDCHLLLISLVYLCLSLYLSLCALVAETQHPYDSPSQDTHSQVHNDADI